LQLVCGSGEAEFADALDGFVGVSAGEGVGDPFIEDCRESRAELHLGVADAFSRGADSFGVDHSPARPLVVF
jgi:hypothetical protein